MTSAVWVRSAALGALIAAACGGGSASPDAGAEPPPRLAIQSPPGDQIGLAPGDAVTLRVRLTTAGGDPIDGAPVSFALIAGDAGTGGATLAAATVATDADGIAEDDLTTGPARADFQVAATSGDAPQALFYVSVSAAGFADALVTPTYTGDRPLADIARIELRAYRGVVDCAGLDPDALPDPTLAPRTVPVFDTPASWTGLPAGEAFTVVAEAIHEASGRPVSFGCAVVAASQVTPGPLALTLGVADRPLAFPALAGGANVATDIDATVVAGLEASEGVDRPWQVLGCPDGGGQLALDWIVDVLADDGMLDGQTVAATGPAGAIEAARGALGTDGCRAATVAGGGPSLDALVEASIAAGPFPSGAARTDLEAGRLALFTHVFLTSLLEPAGPGRFQHELLTAESDDVADSARPVISAEAAYTVENGNVTLAAHGFTARLGSALGDELRVDRLTAVGLGGDADTLGQALVGSARASGGLTGCAAIDAVVCAPAGLAPGCVTAACPAAGTALDGALTAWWRYLDGTGLDLTLVGHAGASDSDGDLVLDLPGTGRWDVALTLASGEQVETAGTWLVEVPIGP